MYKNFTSLRQKTLIGLVLFTVAFSSLRVFATQDPLKASALAAVSVSSQELTQDISLGIMHVPEFLFLQQEAQRMGVKVYLFGGTASSFAHYVRWDIMRAKGDTRLLEDRFGYDMVDIFRNNQDFDIVLDGNADQVQKLQNALDQKFPHMQGKKSAWEVRSLRQAIGTKAALLGNPDFLNQHTDSNSTGMIDLTPGSNDIIKDLRDWNNPHSQFHQDLLEGKIHFYYSNNHDSTEMARQGNNPAIVSVVRLLVKALQFDLELRQEDMPEILKIINDFNPSSIRGNSYLQRRLTETALKLVQNSVNVERSITLLDKLGLKNKLIAVAVNQGSAETAQLLGKEPLRTKTLGEGTGKTAQEMGLSVVSHDTRNLEAYYSILRSPTGEPNVFISRNGANGEVAYYGNGFYVKAGKTGAVDGGLTVRFKLNPNARHGTDFNYVNNDGYIVILNKRALQVIPDLAKMSLTDMAGQYIKNQFGTKDRAVRDKLLKKIKSQMYSDSTTDIENLRLLLLNSKKPGPQEIELLLACAASPKCHDARIQQLLDGEVAQAAKRQALIKELKSIQSLENRPDLAPKFVEGLKDSSGNTSDLLKMAYDFVRSNKRASQAMVINQMAMVNISFAKLAIENINYKDFPEIADAIAEIKDPALAREYAQRNSPAAQVAMLDKLSKISIYATMEVLGSINLSKRPDLLPTVLHVTKNTTTWQSSDFDTVLKYFKNNSANEQLQVADALVSNNRYYGSQLFELANLKNRPDLAPAFLKVLQTNSFRTDEINTAIAFAKGCPPDIQAQIADTLAAQNKYYAHEFIAGLGPIKNTKLLPALLIIANSSSTRNEEMKTLVNFSKSNSDSPEVALKIAETLAKNNRYYATEYLSSIELKNRVDLLPTLLKVLNSASYNNADMQLAGLFTKANPQPDVQVAIATTLANSNPYYASEYVAELNLKKRPDLLPVLVNIVSKNTVSSKFMDTLISYGKSNADKDIQQLESALRSQNSYYADELIKAVGGVLAKPAAVAQTATTGKTATAPQQGAAQAAPQAATNQSPHVGNVKVLLDLPLDMLLTTSHIPSVRIISAKFMADFNAADKLVDMLYWEIMKDANPDVLISILDSLQNNGTKQHLNRMDPYHNAFVTATTGGLKNKFKSLIGQSKAKELEAAWQRTRATMLTNDFITESQFLAMQKAAAAKAPAAGPVCTKIFGN
jgi:hypothetical protein